MVAKMKMGLRNMTSYVGKKLSIKLGSVFRLVKTKSGHQLEKQATSDENDKEEVHEQFL